VTSSPHITDRLIARLPRWFFTRGIQHNAGSLFDAALRKVGVSVLPDRRSSDIDDAAMTRKEALKITL
jgi:hypothetical protein